MMTWRAWAFTLGLAIALFIGAVVLFDFALLTSVRPP